MSVGFGPDGQQAPRDGGLNPGGEGIVRPRRYYPTGPWIASTTVDGRFAWVWNTVPDTSGHIIKGDSGGPLLYTTGGKTYICGIASTGSPTTDAGAGTSTGEASAYTAVQAPKNLAWLESVLLDKGKFRAHGCGPDDVLTGSNDADGDGIPDSCDNCGGPNGYNPEQEDSDGDGFGDACDHCPAVYEADQTENTNRVFEDELGAPRIGDRCDPHPLTVVSGTGEGSSVLSSVKQRSYTRTVTSPGACGGPTSYARDAAQGNAFAGVSFRGYGAAAGVSRFLNCVCPAPFTAEECRSRADLCRPSSVENPTAPRWRQVTALENGNPVTLPSTTSLLNTNHPAYYRWSAVPEFRNFTWKYWTDLSLGALAVGSVTPVFRGIVWGWVKNWNESGAADAGTVREPLEASLRQSYSVLDVREDAATTTEVRPCKWLTRRFFAWKWGSLGPMGTGDVFLNVETDNLTTSSYLARSAYFPERAGAAYMDANVAAAMRDPVQYTIVGASDRKVWAGGTVAGFVMDAKSHQFVREVEQGLSGGVERLTMTAAPAPVGSVRSYPMVAAFSGRRQEIAVFSDRNASNQLLQEMRTYRVGVGNGSQPYLRGETVYAPAAATYRAEDDAYYVLDKNPAPRAVLLRIGRELNVEKIAEWSRGNVYVNYGLSTGSEGSIVITTSAASDALHCVAVLRPDPSVGGNPANATLLPYKRFMATGAIMDQPAQLGMDGAVGMVTRTLDGSREFLGRALATGTDATLADIGACF